MKRIILVSLLLLIASSTYADKYIISYSPDGRIFYTSFAKGYENSAKEIVEASPILRNFPYDIIDGSELPRNPDGSFKDRDYWTGTKDEGIKIDLQKKNADILKKEAEQNLKNSAEKKLKDLGFTDKEIKAIIK